MTPGWQPLAGVWLLPSPSWSCWRGRPGDVLDGKGRWHSESCLAPWPEGSPPTPNGFAWCTRRRTSRTSPRNIIPYCRRQAKSPTWWFACCKGCPFYHRPELLEGKRGADRFQGQKAVVRTKTRFAESVLDMRDSTDYHDLPGDASDLIATPGINRFAGIKLVRECGALFKLFAVPPPNPHWSEQMRSVWPWAITGGFILGAILMATS